ncbi:MAG: flagellar biosynthesis anti-sigma factor FlgM [Deltaproteobacteria bacterium]|nr:flagellar biosynthesis anti-sigma factor FlgM [Deltaproteobacteria bacterium]
MNTSRRRSSGGPRPGASGRSTDPGAGRPPAEAASWPDLPREDPNPRPYRPELVARLERAVRAGRYQPDPRAIAAAMIDRMDELLD